MRIMSLVFNLDIEIEAEKWRDEEERQNYIRNFKNVIEQGLIQMKVPDWYVHNITVIEKGE